MEKAIGKAVPLKETGIIVPARHGGGRLIFIGRHVHRGIDDDSLTIGVDPKFLDTTFTEFNITKGCGRHFGQGYGRQESIARTLSICVLTISPSTCQTSVDGTVKARPETISQSNWESTSKAQPRH